MTDTTTETVERLARFYEKTWGDDGWPSPISDTLRALTAERDALAEKLEAWLEVASHCSIEEGVCCCGDNMENHSHPMNCGHSPVDHGAYVAMQLVEGTRASLAQITGGKTDG